VKAPSVVQAPLPILLVSMSVHMWMCAALLGEAFAWTNPVSNMGSLAASSSAHRAPSSPRAPLSAATLSAKRATPEDEYHKDQNAMTGLYDEDNVSELKTVPSSSSVSLEGTTSIFLDSETHPPGTLSQDMLDTSFAVLNAWSKTATQMGAETAHKILSRLKLEEECTNKQLVTMKHYGTVVEGYSKAKNPRAAEQVLGEMREAPDRRMLNSIVRAWAWQEEVEQAMRVFQQIPSPTTKEYNSLLWAHAKCGNAREAEALLREMVNSENENVHPNMMSYNSVLEGWSKSGEKGAADRALSILSSLPEQPDAFSYWCVTNAYLNEGNTNKVKCLLEQVQSQGIEIGARLQNTLLLAYAKEGNAEYAEQLLDDMEHEGIANKKSYTTVIKAWKESGATDMAQRAEAILDRMVARGLQDIIAYNTVVSLKFCK